jgi:hypothetical protein
VARCRDKWDLVWKDAAQPGRSHVYGRSPECVRTWTVKPERKAKLASQPANTEPISGHVTPRQGRTPNARSCKHLPPGSLHRNGFSLVCVRTWYTSVVFCANAAPHPSTVHTNCKTEWKARHFSSLHTLELPNVTALAYVPALHPCGRARVVSNWTFAQRRRCTLCGCT